MNTCIILLAENIRNKYNIFKLVKENKILEKTKRKGYDGPQEHFCCYDYLGPLLKQSVHQQIFENHLQPRIVDGQNP